MNVAEKLISTHLVSGEMKAGEEIAVGRGYVPDLHTDSGLSPFGGEYN